MPPEKQTGNLRAKDGSVCEDERAWPIATFILHTSPDGARNDEGNP